MEAMLKKITFVLEPGGGADRADVRGEVQRARRAFRDMGFASEVLRQGPVARRQGISGAEEPGGPQRAADAAAQGGSGGDFGRASEASGDSGPGGTLYLCGSGEALRQMRARGFPAVGYSHAGNPGERFGGAPYVVQEPDQVDADSYVKMYQREAGLPWTILETPRCLVREFVEEDLEALYGLYDAEACRFLEPPSRDMEHEREILRAYIGRIYGLYGFGHWAVLLKGRKERLAGRIGYAPLTASQEAEALRLGVREGIPVSALDTSAPDARRAGWSGHAAGRAGREHGKTDPGGAATGIDADFGFLVAPPYRGTGIALEASGALLEYGFSRLGFTRVRADAHRDNTASRRLLRKLGFTLAGAGDGGRLVYLRDAE